MSETRPNQLTQVNYLFDKKNTSNFNKITLIL